MSKRFLIILAVVFALFMGFVVYNKTKSSNQPAANVAGGSNHTQGTGTTGVSVVEFGDFQCPFCGQYYPTLKTIKKEYGNKITFQFRHFPLVTVHENAMSAHRAAEAAGKQDKFWEMHDLLYERQDLWKSSRDVSKIFEGYAAELKLDVEQYKKDVSSQAVADIINADVKAAQALKATSTPTFVIDGVVIKDPPQPTDVEGFKKLVDDAIAKKSQN